MGLFHLAQQQCCAVIFQLKFHYNAQRNVNMKNTVIHSYLKRKYLRKKSLILGV